MKVTIYPQVFSNLLLAIALCFGTKAFAQAPDSLWMHHYGGTDKELGFDAIEGDPGTYYLVGKTKSFSNGGFDAYILKVDNNGGIIWEKHYGDYLDEQIVSICPALYGGYVMTGYTTSNENSAEIWLLWIDDEGDSLWTKTYGNYTSDQGYFIRPNVDQGYTMTARLSVYLMGDQIYLLKIDQAGDTIWTKIYGGSNQDYGHAVIQTSDGGYIVAGRTYASYTPESGDAWVLKTDANGDTIWTKKYGGEDEDIFYCVLETEDGYLFTGQTRSFGPGYINVYAVKTDYEGDTIWTNTYGGDVAQYCYALHETENGNYTLCGYSSSFSAENDVYMLEIDTHGNMIWQDHWGVTAGDEYVYGCRPTSDGGYIITGWTSYYGGWDDELFALKLGESSGLEEGVHTNYFLSVSPNPCRSWTNIHLDVPSNMAASLRVYNSLGSCIYTFFENRLIKDEMDVEWDISRFPAGIYFIRLETQKGGECIKILKSR
jgi:hypothetical protein